MVKTADKTERPDADTTPSRPWIKLIVMLVGFALFACFSDKSPDSNSMLENDPPPLSGGPTPEDLVPIPAGLDYAAFKHESTQHARMPCIVCHKRDDNLPAPKFSGHIPCSSCHKAEFADNQHQICSLCHTGPNTAEMKSFPRLRSFSVKFDHGRHVRETNCSTCHKPTRAGVALSMPSGLNAHVTCFQCHQPGSESGGQDIGSCNTCHEPGSPSRTSESARAFTFNFSHADHRGGNLNCSSCHSVKAGVARGRQVTAPTAAMHLASGRAQSCASCHNNKRAFGGNDFADCKRCHQGTSFKF